MEQIVYKDELERINELDNVAVHFVLSEPPSNWGGEIGLIDLNMLQQLLPASKMKEWLYIICGPNQMIEVVDQALIDIGISGKNIRSESFDYD